MGAGRRSNSYLLGFTALLMACSMSRPSAHPAASAASLAAAEAEIQPLFQRMQTAANAHDADAHLAAYARSPDIVFVINDQAIHGFDALLAQQRQWWHDGKSDVVYHVEGRPEYSMPEPGLVVQTYFLTSKRTGASGSASYTQVGISALWQKRPEGWRIIYAHESTVSK